MAKPIEIGLTGGIGSGKTTVAHLFEKLGFPVYYADDRAKALMNTDSVLIAAIKTLFGDKAYQDGKLNRSFIADKVFTNKTLLQQLNRVVHPAVAHDYKSWVAHQQTHFVMKEAAILIETQGHIQMDEVIVVTAPLEERLARVKQRDQTDEKSILDRISNQMDDAERIKEATFVIENTNLEETKKQVTACVATLQQKYY